MIALVGKIKLKDKRQSRKPLQMNSMTLKDINLKPDIYIYRSRDASHDKFPVIKCRINPIICDLIP